MFNGEGGRIAEETRVENVFDRVETTGTVWLGLTMTCCRCHDHKYDPISQQEYYRLFAFFNNTSETGRSGRGKTAPVLNYLSPSLRQTQTQLAASLNSVQQQLNQPLPDLDRHQAAWEIQQREKLLKHDTPLKLGPWWKLGPIEKAGRPAFDQNLGPEHNVDLSASVSGKTWSKASDVTDGKVYPLPTTVGATFFYREINSPGEHQIQLSLGSDDAIKVFHDGKQVLANFTARAAAADQESLRLTLRPGLNRLLIKVVNTGGIGGLYFKKTSESAFGLPANLIAALKLEPTKRTADQRATIRNHYRRQHWPPWRPLSKQRDGLTRQIDQINRQATTVMVMDELSPEKRRSTPVLLRGGYDKPTDVFVTAGTPQVLPPLSADAASDANRNRLTLAKWLVDPNHPLTARVTVNRYWQLFFGRGLVTTTEDFGSQGTRPSHPDLLDWLAIRFIESGWDVKQLHKLIVMSSTYRQSARVTDQARRIDPENKWLARASRYRLPSWMLRDQALAVGGLQSRTIGGPGVRPYQPEKIWAEATFGKIRYSTDSGEDLYRRSLYVFWRRIVGPTMFFDGAKRQTCEVKPTRTNTPLHALTTLNETAFVEASRKMAQRVITTTSDDRQRIRFAFRLATSRLPNSHELKILFERTQQLRQDFAADPVAAQSLLDVGQSDSDPSLDPSEHAAYMLVCSILLNLDEALSKP